mmetsp:Transcript_866/g.1810  ORF Transcript_866/g.1810 Transcript_866/m.1810 type:complete len:218 (-) Transcript_866:624-1277(-)
MRPGGSWSRQCVIILEYSRWYSTISRRENEKPSPASLKLYLKMEKTTSMKFLVVSTTGASGNTKCTKPSCLKVNSCLSTIRVIKPVAETVSFMAELAKLAFAAMPPITSVALRSSASDSACSRPVATAFDTRSTIVPALEPNTESSPAPYTWGWEASICSTRVDPERIMPTTNTGCCCCCCCFEDSALPLANPSGHAPFLNTDLVCSNCRVCICFRA